jgi:hypothetical protein
MQFNVYRPLALCRGDPCDEITSLPDAPDLILCDCLNRESFDSLYKVAESGSTGTSGSTETGTPTGSTNSTGTNSTIIDTRENPETQPPTEPKDNSAKAMRMPKTLRNFKIWLGSVIAIFGCLTALAILAIFLDSVVITPLAVGFFNKVSTQFLVSQKAKQIIQSSKGDKKEEDKENDTDAYSNSSGSNKQKDLLEGLKRAFKDEKDIMKCLDSTKAVEQMSGLKLFTIVYLTNHFLMSIFFSKASENSRKSIIATAYTRVAYALGITMLIGLGSDKSGHSNYQSLILTCLAAPVIVSPLLFLIKKMTRHDSHYDIFNPCKQKSKVSPDNSDPVQKPDDVGKWGINPEGSNLRTINMFTRNQKRAKSNLIEIPNNAGSPPKSTQEFLNACESPAESGSSSSINSSRSHKGINLIRNVTPKKPIKKTIFGVVRVVTAYALNVAMVPLSTLMIVSAAKTTTKNDNWPVGYWYVAFFAYDLTIGQLPAALTQFGLLKAKLANPSSKLTTFINKFVGSWLLSPDVKAITDLNSSVDI